MVGVWSLFQPDGAELPDRTTQGQIGPFETALVQWRNMGQSLTVQRHRVKQTTHQPRRPVSLAQKERMIAASLEGQTIAEIAEELGRSEHTVRNVLRSPEAVARKEQLAQDIRDSVRLKLIRAAHRAVDSWLKAIDHADAGVKAQHLPAKDLLISAGIISPPGRPKQEKPEVIVQVYKPAEPPKVEVEDGPEAVAELPAAVTHQRPDDS